MCWLHDTIHLATVTLQESREFGGFVKVGPKSSLRPFLHRALQLFIEVEVNRPGYLPSRKCGEVNILGFSPTLR